VSTFTHACLQADKLIAGAFLVFAHGGCGARSGLDAEPIDAAFVGEAHALEDAGSGPSPEGASPQPCSSFTAIASCIAGGCSACVSSPGWWICFDPNGGAIIEDDAGRELGACDDLANRDEVTGPRQRL
jgi:hypothetical protein